MRESYVAVFISKIEKKYRKKKAKKKNEEQKKCTLEETEGLFEPAISL